MNNFSSSLTSLNLGCCRALFWDQSSCFFIHHPCVALLYSTTCFFTSSLMTSLFSPESLTQILAPLSLNYRCLSALNSWFSQSQLKLNPTKGGVMFVGSSRLLAKCNLPSVVTLDGTTFPISPKLKILGVTLDSNLNFAHFISQIIQSSNFHIYAIKQVRKFLPLSTANALFISLVLSRLDYYNSLFCGQPNYLLCKLQAFQNHAAKTVL